MTHKRINVQIAPETAAALKHIIDGEGVTLTEAVRRLVGYGAFLYRAANVEPQRVVIEDSDGAREVRLL